MNTVTRLAISLSLVGLSCSLPYVAIAATNGQASIKTATAAHQKASFLFVLRADTGVISKTDSGYTLTLKGMDDKVLYFSDRPVRKAGFITMTKFMGEWAKGNNSFKANPPNAAIVHAALKSNETGIAQAIPVELSDPVITANGWMFHLKDLRGKISIGSYNGVSVFVDSKEGTLAQWCPTYVNN